ncbi:MAG: DUF411 domain-containing protein [Hyphomicrobiales bacterium]|nr:DUF411 domain-containing protein [Hyphomicrobiales bacterium]MCP5000464.1 DUF411 domain-containing protein [Hyphomicrobiales bacterium]
MRKFHTALIAAVIALSGFASAHAGKKGNMTVFKTPWCGCCEAWTDIMKAAGYTVEVKDLDDLSLIKKQAGVPADMEGCHTAAVENYVIEGHVPLAAIDKLMSERPGIRGIAVPGMPDGAPGMGDDPDARFTVYSFAHDPSETGAVFYEAGK